MRFSACMCVYDKDSPIYFKEALNSLINQKLLPTQIVIVADGIININLMNIIKSFKTKTTALGITLTDIYLPVNVGHGKARKTSIENAHYNIIALADADDINEYYRFYKQIEIFKNDPYISIVGTQIIEIEHNTKKLISRKEVPLTNLELRLYIKSRCPFNQMSVMFKKNDVLAVGNYVDFYHNEDYYLWIRMYLANYKFCNLPDALVLARVNQEFYDRRGGIKYFVSEYKIQKIMWDNKMISFARFIFNVGIRFILQVVLTRSLRGIIFKKFFRKGV